MRAKSAPKSFKILKRVFFIVLIASTLRIVYTHRVMYLQEKEVEREIKKLMAIELKKQEKLNYELELNLSDEYIERIAREQWGFLKSHEIKFINRNN